MKKTVFILMAAFALISLSCSDDNDEHRPDFPVPELTDDNSVQLTVNASGTLHCELFAGGLEVAIDWGDGTLDKYNAANNEHCKHTYKKAGDYRVKIWSDKLTFLYVSALGLPYTELSLGYCPVMKELSVNGFSEIKHFNLDNCPQLESLIIGNFENLESLDIGQCSRLKELACYTHPNLKKLDISRNKELQSLDLNGLPLDSFDITSNKALQILVCANMKMKKLSVKENTQLLAITLAKNEMEELELGELKDCRSLTCMDNALTTLDISGLPVLNVLDCRENQLTTLDVSHNPVLINLRCDKNQLTDIIIDNNEWFEGLICNSNKLSADALNKIFTALPESEIKAPTKMIATPQPNRIQYYDNPGTEQCDSKIITDKGWQIITEKQYEI